MLDLTFGFEGAEAVEFAALPLITVKLRIATTGATRVHGMMLNAQVRLEPQKRDYTAIERERLFDLFGAPRDWGRTLRGMLWTQASVVVPAFEGSSVVDVLLPCTTDLAAGAALYCGALEAGDVAITALFSGSVFLRGDDGGWSFAPIPWNREASLTFPVSLYQSALDRFAPNTSSVAIPRDVLERLRRYKSTSALPTWESVFDRLLTGANA